MTVDEILATGRYTDKRGRAWNYDPDFDVWVEYSSREDGILDLGWIVDTKDVRLLIERDQHRDECPGLEMCWSHPVPSVLIDVDGLFWVSPANSDAMDALLSGYNGDPEYDTLHAAMDAARALAVGE